MFIHSSSSAYFDFEIPYLNVRSYDEIKMTRFVAVVICDHLQVWMSPEKYDDNEDYNNVIVRMLNVKTGNLRWAA